MIKKFVSYALLVIPVICFGGQYSQEECLNQLASTINLSVSESQKICANPPWAGKDENLKSASTSPEETQTDQEEGISPKCLSLDKEREKYDTAKMSKKSLTFETYAVSISVICGYTFHIADYADGTRVVSCLDGPLRGDQFIIFLGIQINETKAVEWHGDYFIHFYPHGQIISYVNKQVSVIY